MRHGGSFSGFVERRPIAGIVAPLYHNGPIGMLSVSFQHHRHPSAGGPTQPLALTHGYMYVGIESACVSVRASSKIVVGFFVVYVGIKQSNRTILKTDSRLLAPWKKIDRRILSLLDILFVYLILHLLRIASVIIFFLYSFTYRYRLCMLISPTLKRIIISRIVGYRYNLIIYSVTQRRSFMIANWNISCIVRD